MSSDSKKSQTSAVPKPTSGRPKDWAMEFAQWSDAMPYKGSARSLRGEVAAAKREKQLGFSGMSFSKEEIKNLKQLLEVEKIRSLRMKYNQLIDSRDLNQLVNLFTPDGICEFGPYGSWKGKREIYKNYFEVFEDNWMHKFSSMHYNTNHLVDLIDETAHGEHVIFQTLTPEKARKKTPLFGWPFMMKLM